MNFDEMNSAYEDAKRTMFLADRFADRFAALLVGRLRKVNSGTLADLKKELRKFNIHTRTWSDT